MLELAQAVLAFSRLPQLHGTMLWNTRKIFSGRKKIGEVRTLEHSSQARHGDTIRRRGRATMTTEPLPVHRTSGHAQG